MQTNLQMPGAMPGLTPAPVAMLTELPTQTISTANTVPHTLGAAPSIVQVRYRSVSYTSNGVTVGMEVDPSFYSSDIDTASAANIYSGCWVSSTAVIVTPYSTTQSFRTPNGSYASIDFSTAAWELVVRVAL